MSLESFAAAAGLMCEKGAIRTPRESFADTVTTLLARGARLTLMYATDDREMSGDFGVHAALAIPREVDLVTVSTVVPAHDASYPSLTKSCMAAHWYERQMHDQFGIVAVGHPDWRRLMHHENIPEGTYPLRKDFAWDTRLAHAAVPYPMHQVEGKGVYEIPVGPIHAGIIEPGHFRFNVRGERILTLEGKLFFTHKGVEKLVEGRTPEEALPFVERVSGDMPVGHTLAYVQAVERVCAAVVPERAEYLRTIYNELERVTMHVFDIGNIGGNGTGFTFMAAQGFRNVEILRRLFAQHVGHRFLRGAITLGGAHDLSGAAVQDIVATVERVTADMQQVIDIAYASDGLMERFETTGILTREAAGAYGAEGVAARASGVDRDMRRDHPYAAYQHSAPSVITETAGDVAARFAVRVRELLESLRLIKSCAAALPEGAVQAPLVYRAGSAYGWAEAWRGGVVDWVRMDSAGKIDRLVIRDPSFCNWPLFGELAPGNIVPDFPLCNKSLNLSYSGTDL
ncbi:MAG: NADH-quinone oxidoreductase subunit C [Patescibacteria group bacterium]